MGGQADTCYIITKNSIAKLRVHSPHCYLRPAIMAGNEKFTKAAEAVKNLKEQPTDQELLTLYANYKQVTVGDCNTDRPGMLDFKGKAKWDEWNKLKGKSADDAANEYVTLAHDLIGRLGLKE